MKSIIFLILSTVTFLMTTNCAITHKRGSDPQVAVDYYLNNRGTLPQELKKMVNLNKINEAEVTLKWTVNERGETQDISIPYDTLHNESVNTLLMEHLKALKFPETPHFTTSTVEYTYKFKQAETKKK